MTRLYANENSPLPVVEELRRLGHDVLTIHETGKAGQSVPDEAVLAFACADRRALLTLNRKHFIDRDKCDAIFLKELLKAKRSDQSGKN